MPSSVGGMPGKQLASPWSRNHCQLRKSPLLSSPVEVVCPPLPLRNYFWVRLSDARTDGKGTGDAEEMTLPMTPDPEASTILRQFLSPEGR